MSVRAGLAQGKVLAGGDGLVTLALDIAVEDVEPAAGPAATDLVVVLDVSGSMSGTKIVTARQAVSRLIEDLRPEDRFALVTFSSDVHTDIPLSRPSPGHGWLSIVQELNAGGGTDLQSGVRSGLRELRAAGVSGVGARRVLLLSDGMAAMSQLCLTEVKNAAIQLECAVTTLGIGQGFNEEVMTSVADAGAGNAYYLPDTSRLASIFEAELLGARRTVARSTTVHVEEAPGVQLVSAAGYPVTRTAAGASFRPGDLRAGQQRTLHLTYRVPVDEPRDLELGAVSITCLTEAGSQLTLLPEVATVTCTTNPQEVIASIDRAVWERVVANERFGALQVHSSQLVARDQAVQAQREVDQWIADHRALNVHVGSDLVAGSLDAAARLSRQITQARTPQARNVFSKEQLYSGKGKRRSGAWLSWD